MFYFSYYSDKTFNSDMATRIVILQGLDHRKHGNSAVDTLLELKMPRIENKEPE